MQHYKKDFKNFCLDNKVNLLYYFQPMDKISRGNVKFTNILKQAHRFLEKSQIIESNGQKNLEDVDIAMRVLVSSLEIYPFATAYLFNISVVMMIQSRFVDAIMVLKKL
tara:strand:+ start:498 stop:824 length:327 start_codon:yes stop_codon:yes gene_type:complete